MNNYAKYQAMLKCYPDIITKEQLYQICHISKRTALYYLESGIIPCENSGKKTRKYKIAKEDVIEFLVTRDNNPDKYRKPSGWYAGQNARMPRILSDEEKEKLGAFYQNELLTDYPDVMGVPDVCQLLGYSKESVFRWIRKGHLNSFKAGTNWKVPKPFLVEFMLSTKFLDIVKKTEEHDQITLRSLSALKNK